MRLAIEAHEALGGLVSRVDLLPCAHPPHKESSGILSFAIRTELIREAVAPYPWLFCNEVEGERETFSYTWDTLAIYAEREPGRRVYFLLGSPDYELLPTWHNGLRLPERCTLAVVPRGIWSEEDFRKDTLALWPDAEPARTDVAGASAMRAAGGEILRLPLPWFEVSSSLIRERWIEGRCLDYPASSRRAAGRLPGTGNAGRENRVPRRRKIPRDKGRALHGCGIFLCMLASYLAHAGLLSYI